MGKIFGTDAVADVASSFQWGVPVCALVAVALMAGALSLGESSSGASGRKGGRMRPNGKRPRPMVYDEIEAGDHVRISRLNRKTGREVLVPAEVVARIHNDHTRGYPIIRVKTSDPDFIGGKTYFTDLDGSEVYPRQRRETRGVKRSSWTVYNEHGDLVLKGEEPFDGDDEYRLTWADGTRETFYAPPITLGPRAQRDKRMVRALALACYKRNLKRERFQYGVVGEDGRVYDYKAKLLGHGA
jgi:hypothetical protein